MSNHASVFRVIIFLFVCLCVFGSTKSQSKLVAITASARAETFDVANSTVTQEVESSREITESKVTPLVVPPQPRNARGEFVCTKDRYIQGERQVGQVSWYGDEFHGKRTASGEVFDKNANTIAHLTLPMGTYVRLENRSTGASEIVRVNDCGPFVRGRIADIPEGVAYRLGLKNTGDAEAVITVLRRG
jgi:rare lipoprotein A